jgi:histidine phosphotransferase ChpT
MSSVQSDPSQTLELASLLCSRLCHDLLSPVGALVNGLELLAEEKDPQMRQRCFELLEQSARTSADKLKFFRLAFGAAGGFGEAVPVAEPRALIEALAGPSGRIALSWQVGSQTLPKAAVKILLNLALIGIDALVRGGTLEIVLEERGGGAEIAVRASGPRVAFDPAIGRALASQLAPGELSSRTAPAAMIAGLATSCGGCIQYAFADGMLVMGATLPAA